MSLKLASTQLEKLQGLLVAHMNVAAARGILVEDSLARQGLVRELLSVLQDALGDAQTLPNQDNDCVFFEELCKKWSDYVEKVLRAFGEPNGIDPFVSSDALNVQLAEDLLRILEYNATSLRDVGIAQTVNMESLSTAHPKFVSRLAMLLLKEMRSPARHDMCRMSYRELQAQIEDKNAQIRRLEALLKPEGEVLHVKEFERREARRIRASQKTQNGKPQSPSMPSVKQSRGRPTTTSACPKKRQAVCIEIEDSPPPRSRELADLLSADGTSTAAMSIPPHRAAILSKPSRVKIGNPVLFAREFIEDMLGGDTRSHVVEADLYERPRTALAREYNINQYLVLRKEFHAWLPAAPGQEGFMFPRHRISTALSRSDGPRHLFVQPDPDSNFYYCGLYDVENQPSVTPEEWSSLDQTGWAVNFVRKTKDRNVDGSLREALAKYQSGCRLLSCARLRYREFNTGFYQRMVRESRAAEHAPAAKRPKTTEKDSDLEWVDGESNVFS